MTERMLRRLSFDWVLSGHEKLSGLAQTARGIGALTKNVLFVALKPFFTVDEANTHWHVFVKYG